MLSHKLIGLIIVIDYEKLKKWLGARIRTGVNSEYGEGYHRACLDMLDILESCQE